MGFSSHNSKLILLRGTNKLEGLRYPYRSNNNPFWRGLSEEISSGNRTLSVVKLASFTGFTIIWTRSREECCIPPADVCHTMSPRPGQKQQDTRLSTDSWGKNWSPGLSNDTHHTCTNTVSTTLIYLLRSFSFSTPQSAANSGPSICDCACLYWQLWYTEREYSHILAENNT